MPATLQFFARPCGCTPACTGTTHQGGGKLYGRPTGGNRRGINGGCFIFVRLPASGLELDLPLVGYFPTAPQPDAGIVPDVQVAADMADISAGRDPALIRAATDLRRA